MFQTSKSYPCTKSLVKSLVSLVNPGWTRLIRLLPVKPGFTRLLRAIFLENRESQDTRQKLEFFVIWPKHPFEWPNLRKNSFGFKRFILKEKLKKVWKIDFIPVFRTKHGRMQWQLREKGERVRNIPWHWNFTELLFCSYSWKP